MGRLKEITERVLFVTRAGAEGSGGAVGHHIALEYHRELLAPESFRIFHVPLPSGPFPLRKWRTLVGLRDGYLSGVNAQTLRQFVTTLRQLRPSMVLLDSSLFGPLARLAREAGYLTVTQLQNCEYDFYAGDAALRGVLAGPVLRAAYLAESQSIEASHLVLALSRHDAERVAHIYRPQGRLLTVNPLLTRLARGLQAHLTAPLKPPRDPACHVFLASDSHQNRLACQWLLDRWYHTRSRLTIIGRISDWVLRRHNRAQLERRGIHVAGFVSSLADFLGTSTTMLSPMWLGSGVKVKIIDALAHGCPVVASQEAAQGFEFANETGMILPLDNSTFDALLMGRLAPEGDAMALRTAVNATLANHRAGFIEALEGTRA